MGTDCDDYSETVGASRDVGLQKIFSNSVAATVHLTHPPSLKDFDDASWFAIAPPGYVQLNSKDLFGSGNLLQPCSHSMWSR